MKLSISGSFTVNTVEDGVSPVVADLSNENVAVECDAERMAISSHNIRTIARMWYGTTPIAFTASRDDDSSDTDLNVSFENNGTTAVTIKVNISAGDTIGTPSEEVFNLTATYNGQTFTRKVTLLVHSIVRGTDGTPAITYELVPSETCITRRKDGTYYPTKLTCGAVKIVNGVTSNPSSGECVIKVRINGASTAIAYPSGGVPISSAITTGVVFELYANGNTTTPVDKETIPVLVDGNDSVVYDVMTSLSALRPDTQYVDVVVRKTVGTTMSDLVSDEDLAGDGLSYTFSGTGSFGDATKVAQAWDDTSGTFYLSDSMDYPLSGQLSIAVMKGTTKVATKTLDVVADGTDGVSTRTERRYRSVSQGPSYNMTLYGDPNNNISSWIASPTALTTTNRYRFVTQRTSNDGGTTWTTWTTPVLDGYMPEDGRSISIAGRALAVITEENFSVDGYKPSDLEAAGVIDDADVVRQGDVVLYNWDSQSDRSGYDAGSGVFLDEHMADEHGTCYISLDGHLWERNAYTSSVKWDDLGRIKGEDGQDAATVVISPDAVFFVGDADKYVNNTQRFSVVISMFSSNGEQLTIDSARIESAPSGVSAVIANPSTSSTIKTMTVNNSASDSADIEGGVMVKLTGHDTASKIYTAFGCLSSVVTQAGANGAPGERGKIGRFYYYAGAWEDAADSDTFLVTDAQTPFFSYNNDCWVWVGSNPPTGDTYMKQQMDTPSSSSANWQIMPDDFKYLITEAVFGNYAHFGGFIVNGDWMMSQYGYMLGFGNKKTAINNNSQYMNADPDDILGEDDMLDPNELIWNKTSEQTPIVVSSTSFVASGLAKYYFVQGRYYTIEIDEETQLLGGVLQWKIATSGTATARATGTLSSTYTGRHTNCYNFLCSTSGTYSLYYRATTGQVNITGIYMRECKFVPYYAVDMKAGRMIANNIVARGELHADMLYYTMKHMNANNDFINVDQESIINIGTAGVGTKVVLPAPGSSKGRVVEVYNNSTGWYATWTGATGTSTFNCAYGSGLGFRTDILLTYKYIKYYCDGDDWWVLRAETS